MQKEGLIADIYKAMSTYNMAIDIERIVITTMREKERDNENSLMERLDRQLLEIVRRYDEEYDKSSVDENVVGALRVQMEIVRGLLENATVNAKRNIAAYQRTISAYNERVAAEDMTLSGYLLTVTNVTDTTFTLPKHNPIAVIIPKGGLMFSLPPTGIKVIPGPLTLKLSPNSITLSINLTKWLAGKLTVRSVFETGEQSIVASLEALGNGIGIQHTTYRGQ